MNQISTLKPHQGLAAIVREDRLEASLWRRWISDGDVSCREALFDQHEKYARSLAKLEYRRRPKYGLEFSDFEQLAIMGLLDSINRYDPNRGCGFRTFAQYRIIGSIADGLARSNEDAALYAKRQRVENDRIRSLLKSSHQANGSDPLLALSDLVGSLAVTVLLESVVDKNIDNIPDPDASDVFESLHWNELLRRMRDALHSLAKPEKTVTTRHYLDGLNFSQIADLLRLSRSRISQIHKSAIFSLRDQLKRFR